MDIIRSKFPDLTERINNTISKQIACDLYATEIFTLEEMNDVLSNSVAQEVARRLITSVLNKGEESCKYFLQSLENRDIFLFHSLMGTSGLLHGLCNLVEIEKLVLQNIRLNEKDAELLASSIQCLHELRILQLSDVPNIGNGLEHIIESFSHNCYQIKELHLNNCCLTANAVMSLTQNVYNFRDLEVLDLSDNYLEDDGKHAVEELGIALTQLPALRTLKLPGGTNIKGCLDKLICQLKRIPTLSNLAIKRWNMSDEDMIKLAIHFREDFKKLSFLDLSCNNVGSNGWISLVEALQNLKNLRHFDLSTENIFTPIGHVVQSLCSVVEMLPHLSSLNLSNWELDSTDLSKMKNAKLIHRKGEYMYKQLFQVENN